jgi:RNA polymerase sigma factor (sigma-70 family)
MMVLRMPVPTDGEPERIARNPSRRSGRTRTVWDVPDEALLSGIAAGDADATVALVRRFQSRVYGCALAIVRDPGRAEDIAQEAFVRAWRHADVYDARRASVSTWLLAITRNLAIDALRVEQVRPTASFDGHELALLDASPDPSVLAARGAEVARVARALDRLPRDQRRAVLLAALYGRTAREIGDIEDIPVGTAKTRLRNGLQKVRLALVEEEAQ